MLQLLAKILRLLRREGAAGAWSRLRNPKDARDFNQVTLKLPIRIVGTDTALIESLTASLTPLLGSGSVVQCSPNGASITLDPRPCAVRAYSSQDVLFFTRDEAAFGFLRAHGLADFVDCNAIFLPSAGCIDAFVTAGLSERKHFLLSEHGATALTATVLRWLLFCGLVPVQSLDTDLFPELKSIREGDQLCISLPESNRRRTAFNAVGPQDFRLFAGIKWASGWQGCAWSYASIARAALKNRAYPITICEDDMRPGAQFDEHLALARDYLDRTDWDIFSGLLTNVSEDCNITQVERRGDLTFVHLDCMTGMVLNIYGRKALERLADWRPSRGGPEVNTIDAWLGSAGALRVVTVLPFLVSHASDQNSTIFGCRNKRYDSVIAASERRLKNLVAEFETSAEAPDCWARKPNSGVIETA